MRSSVHSKLALAALSAVVALGLVIATYELSKNAEYRRWRENYDNFGWLDRVTVPSPNPVLMWEYRPYGRHAGVLTNRYGFRDRDYRSTDKAHGTYRVAFAGDSVTLGMGVRLRDTFFRRFEIMANERQAGIRIQALSFAVDGYNTPQVLELIRTRVLEFSPDKVVYMMCLNDFDFDESSGEKILYFRKPRSFFLATIEAALRDLAGTEFHRYHFGKNKAEVFRALLAMKELLEEERIAFQVALVPIFPEPPATFEEYPLLDLHRAIGDFLDANDVSFFDLRPAFAGSGAEPADLSLDVWHPNEKGHQLMAERLLAPVLDEPRLAGAGFGPGAAGSREGR